VQYFGQAYEPASCDACDLCLGDSEEVPDAPVVAQKILSCVARVRQSFGIGHVVAVLRGQNTIKIRERRHDRLTTFGLLSDYSEANLRDWIYQLIGQEVLVQTDDEYPKLRLNAASWEVMRGLRGVRLVQLVRRQKRKSKATETSWEGVDQGLFDELKALRRELATERQVPPYVIFSDATLREMARVRPTTAEALRQVYGVGESKLRDFGARSLALIAAHCRQHNLAPGEPPSEGPVEPREAPTMTARKEGIFEMFRQGASLDGVMQHLSCKRATAVGHLEDYIRAEKPRSIDAWVERGVYDRVLEAARQVGSGRMKPVFLALGEAVGYDEIRLVLAHVQAHADEF
jgi:ATP-dependent DNA helicase RecQ